MIHSPAVPFFRDGELRLLEEPFALSILTAPAPNAGAALEKDPSLGDEITRVLHARARKVLALAAAHHHPCVILGAWGCGVFRNDPAEVARAFAGALAEMGGAFSRVVFAIRDSAGRNYAAFARQFA
jgi:uncharacterized protein (TIGR02452 family)